jgi:hypothetical protein
MFRKRIFVSIIVFALVSLACGLSSQVSDKKSTMTFQPTETIIVPGSSLWYRLRGGEKLDQGWGVDVDSEHNIYFATYQQAPGKLFTDMVIYKFSPNGDELWQAHWGGKYQEKAFVVRVHEPYVFVGGTTYTSANDLYAGDMVILALKSDTGDLVWDYEWGQGFGYEEVDGLVVDGESIYISGWTTGEKTSCDIGVLKLNMNGQLEWVSTWGSDGWDEADGQMVVDDQFIYVAGRYNANSILTGGKALVAKFNKSDGKYVSHVTWGGAQFNDALGLGSDGVYLYAVGLTLSYGSNGQIFLLKYDKDLNLIWEQIWGGKNGETARALGIDPQGNILIAGQTDSYGNGGNDIVLLQYSPQGHLNWYKTWGGTASEGALDIVMDEWIGYIAANTKSFGSGQDDALLIKIDGAAGNFPEMDAVK